MFEIRLKPNYFDLDEVVVTGNYKPVSVDKSIYDIKLIGSPQIENQPAVTHVAHHWRIAHAQPREQTLVAGERECLARNRLLGRRPSSDERLRGHDLAAAGLTRTEARAQSFLAGPAYQKVEQQVVCRRNGRRSMI